MRRSLIFIAILIVLLPAGATVFAGEHLYITLKIPTTIPVSTPNGQSVIIQSVTDNRFFGGLSSPVDLPSWGVDKKGQTDELKHRAVGRAVLRGERTKGNVLTGMGDITSVTQEIVSSAFKGLGYTVIEKKEDMKEDTIAVDIAINTFWGYFQEAFIGGNMNVTIETTITIHKKDTIQKRTTRVTAKQSARYPNKPENWEKVFNMALSDYLNAVRSDLKQ